MLDALLIILDRATAERRLIDNFSYILENKIVGVQIGVGTQTIAFFLGLDNRDLCELFLLEALVLAVWSAMTLIVETFDFRESVNAVGVFAASMVNAVACCKVSITEASQMMWFGSRYSSLQSQPNASWSADPMYFEP